MKIPAGLVVVALISVIGNCNGVDVPDEIVEIDPPLDCICVDKAVKHINKYFQDKLDSRPREAESIVSAFKQHVFDGTKYTIKIEVSGGSTAELCSVEYVWRPFDPDFLTRPVSCSN